MAQLYTLEIGVSYQFSLHASAILGAGYESAAVAALLDHDSAQRLQDVDGIHASVLSLLPLGTPADPSRLTYVKLKVAENEWRVLALNWIAHQPVALTSESVTVVIANCPPGRLPVLASALRSNGFDQFVFQ